MRGISKAFPGVRALDDVSIQVGSGEVHAIVGENGAGKSTLIKILGGIHQADSGLIEIDGERVFFSGPLDSISSGIAIIHQELNLIPEMSVRENMFLGREKSKLGFLNKKQEDKEAKEFFDSLGIDINLSVPCGSLSVGIQQLVEITKSLSMGAKIIVMDEPSASLSEREVDFLFKMIQDLRASGVAIVYISHRLDEIFKIADSITVLRDGNMVGSRSSKDFDRQSLVELMVGRSLEQEFPPRTQGEIGEIRLELKNLSREPRVRNVSLQLRAGEILGITGLVGAGRTELARLIYGADKARSGSIHINGKESKIDGPLAAIANGICFLTEDRKHQGLILGLSSRENFGVANLDHWISGGFVSKKKETSDFLSFVEDLDIRLSGPEQLAKNLSGGNQQKVLIARWLESDADIIIFDEPTRGIDVGAKFEIYQLIQNLASQGKAILLISSELPEVMALCDPIMVMREGEIAGIIKNSDELRQNDLLNLALGKSKLEMHKEASTS